MNDMASVKISQPVEDLAGEIRKMSLVVDVSSFKRSAIHELQQNLDFSVVIVHIVALDHVLMVHIPEDLDLAADLPANGVLVIPVNHLERIESGRRAMNHLIDGTTGAAADSIEPVEFREAERVVLMVTR